MVWLFQANPKRYDLAAAIAKETDANWAMNQHRDLVSVGDRIFFWESGSEAKLVAVGHVTSPVYERDDSAFGNFLVDVQYDYRVVPPLTREEVLGSGQPLADYKPFIWLMGTNHPIRDPAITAAIEDSIGARLIQASEKLPVTTDVQASQGDLEDAIKNAKLQTARALRALIAEMDPIAFEWLVRAVLSKLGYVDIEVTKPSNDGGVDLRARLVVKGVTNIETAVQAKRTASVSRPVVQNLRGSLSARESGLIVTSGRFTDSAFDEAREPTKAPIALIDGSKLVELMLEFGVGSRQQSFKVYTLQPDALSLENLKGLAIDAIDDET